MSEPTTDTNSAAAGGPKAKAAPTLSKGQQVKHPDGYTYTVEAVLKEGVRLKGVANLVNAAVLSPVAAD